MAEPRGIFVKRSATLAGLAGILAVAGGVSVAAAQQDVRHQPAHKPRIARAVAGYRPLDIGRRAGFVTRGPHAGLIVRRNEIYAPGGFSAHGYGYGRPNSEAAIRAAQNADVRYRTSGLYGYGLDGVGGIGFGDGLETGYNNPYYGNSFSRYTGYNGLPTDIAFGPAFGNRYIADHEPEFADDPDRQPLFSSPEDIGLPDQE